MSTVTYRGQLPVGQQAELKLSTNNGLTGYRIKKLQTISSTPGDGDVEHILQVFTTDQTGSISASVSFENPSLLGVSYNKEQQNTTSPSSQNIIFDQEIVNQDIYVNLTDAAGGTTPGNYFIELEKIKLDLNASTVSTLKNIRQSKADAL
jgi:hypothetical protein